MCTVKTASILQQTPNPEANFSENCCAQLWVSLGDVYTTHVYCDDALVDHTHYWSKARSWRENELAALNLEFVTPRVLARGKLVAIGSLQAFLIP